MKNINTLKVGDSLESVIDRLGDPDCINKTNYNFIEYVYNYSSLTLFILFSDSMIFYIRKLQKEN